LPHEPKAIGTKGARPGFKLLQAADRAAGRLLTALTVSPRAERNVVVALAAYAAIWALYGTIAKSSQGLHFDMAEVIAWSRDLSFGYLKHPPFAAALVWLWFRIFPVAEWSYYLLAMLMPAVALWIVWRLSADYLDSEKRVAGVALLTLVPFFNFHALKFNVNTILLPLWAAATFAFLRSYRAPRAGNAALAGVAAAACMLGKYWSAVLLAGLGLTALIDRRRAAYFRSPAPWITVAVGLAVLAPHLVWLVRHDFAPFAYAVGVHGEKPIGTSVLDALGYLTGSAGYVAIPVIWVFVLARPKGAAVADMAWPADPERRLVAEAFWLPLLLPALIAPIFGAEITSLWSMSAWTLLPILLLSSPAVELRPADARRILGTAVALPLLALIAAPAIAILDHRAGPPPSTAQARQLAMQVESSWHKVTPQPLRFVGGNPDLAYAVIAYAPEAPRALPGMPAPADAVLKRAGAVFVCFADDTRCRKNAAAEAKRIGTGRNIVTFSLRRDFLGMPGRRQNYAITIQPPQR
jgi:4-amino-4-deoxy-L-arabinose transferase-like glycosyltransferase